MGAFTQLIRKILDEAINPFLLFLFALAIAVFLWGLIEFLMGADNEEKRETGKRHLVYGLIGLFIMFAVWGIIAVIQNFLASIS